MEKVYYIWGPKFIGGELNGPDLLAGITLRDGKLLISGRAPHLLLNDISVSELAKMSPEESELLFHLLVINDIPASLQRVFKNASYEESLKVINSLPENALID